MQKTIQTTTFHTQIALSRRINLTLFACLFLVLVENMMRGCHHKPTRTRIRARPYPLRNPRRAIKLWCHLRPKYGLTTGFWNLKNRGSNFEQDMLPSPQKDQIFVSSFAVQARTNYREEELKKGGYTFYPTNQTKQKRLCKQMGERRREFVPAMNEEEDDHGWVPKRMMRSAAGDWWGRVGGHTTLLPPSTMQMWIWASPKTK